MLLAGTMKTRGEHQVSVFAVLIRLIGSVIGEAVKNRLVSGLFCQAEVNWDKAYYTEFCVAWTTLNINSK